MDEQLGSTLVPVIAAAGSHPPHAFEVLVAAPKKPPYARLKKYLDDNLPDGLIDLRDPMKTLPEGHDHARAPGYIGVKARRSNCGSPTSDLRRSPEEDERCKL